MAKHQSWACAALFVLAVSIFSITPVTAQAGPSAAPTTTVDVHALPSMAPALAPSFDAEKATSAYLSRVSGEARAKSDSYFEGGYWLTLWDALYAIVVSGLLLFLRISSQMRKIAEGMTRSRFWQVPIYIVQYIVLTTVLTLPMTIYENYFREHAYGLSNQNFLQWFGRFRHRIWRQPGGRHDPWHADLRDDPRQQTVLVGVGYCHFDRVLRPPRGDRTGFPCAADQSLQATSRRSGEGAHSFSRSRARHSRNQCL